VAWSIPNIVNTSNIAEVRTPVAVKPVAVQETRTTIASPNPTQVTIPINYVPQIHSIFKRNLEAQAVTVTQQQPGQQINRSEKQPLLEIARPEPQLVAPTLHIDDAMDMMSMPIIQILEYMPEYGVQVP
jgi:hypothetical protein